MSVNSRERLIENILYESDEMDSIFGESDLGEVTLPESSPENHQTEEKTEEGLKTLSSELEDLKNQISDLKVKYPEDTNPEVASALDDATSAIDLAVHHLGDISEKIETDVDDGGIEQIPPVDSTTIPESEPIV